jgi:hypothetical protein
MSNEQLAMSKGRRRSLAEGAEARREEKKVVISSGGKKAIDTGA